MKTQKYVKQSHILAFDGCYVNLHACQRQKHESVCRWHEDKETLTYPPLCVCQVSRVGDSSWLVSHCMSANLLRELVCVSVCVCVCVCVSVCCVCACVCVRVCALPGKGAYQHTDCIDWKIGRKKVRRAKPGNLQDERASFDVCLHSFQCWWKGSRWTVVEERSTWNRTRR